MDRRAPGVDAACRRCTAGLALTLVIFTCAHVAAAPAHVATYDYLGKGKSVASMKRGSKVVKCKDRSRLVGGGVTNTAGQGQASISALRPIDIKGHGDPDHVADDGFKATIDNHSDATLHMKTWAICAKRKVAKHFVYRSEQADFTDGANSLVLDCPSGSRIVSGGGLAPGGFGESSVHFSVPQDGPDPNMLPDDEWGFYVDLTAARTVTVYAVCAKGKWARGLHYVTSESNIGPNFGFLKAKCANGQRVLGGGAQGTDLAIETLLSDDGPADGGDPGVLPDNSWIAHANVPNSPTPYGVYAICHR